MSGQDVLPETPTCAAISTHGLTVRYGAVSALSDLGVDIPRGSITGVIGPNGAGKTTLLNALAGFTPVTRGTVHLAGIDITRLPAAARVKAGLVRSFQTVRLLEHETALTNVMVGVDRLPHPNLLAQLLGLPSTHRAERRNREAAHEMLAFLGIDHVADTPASSLPFGARRLIEMARVLVSRPEVLLLDEPAAGLDEAARRQFEQVLRKIHGSYDCTLVLVEHDVDLVRRLCNHAVALDAGRHVATGPPEDVLADEAVRLAYFGS